MGSRTALVKAYGSSSEAAPFGVIPFALHPLRAPSLPAPATTTGSTLVPSLKG